MVSFCAHKLDTKVGKEAIETYDKLILQRLSATERDFAAKYFLSLCQLLSGLVFELTFPSFDGGVSRIILTPRPTDGVEAEIPNVEPVTEPLTSFALGLG